MPLLQSVGVLDSGVGGLSVLACLQEALPGQSFLYVADSAHAPYGSLSSAEILDRCRTIMAFFKTRNVGAVVLACNTATAAAVAQMRAEFDLPIIGMEPALKPAAALTQTGVVAVLATEGTLNSDRFLALKDRFARNVEAVTVACNGWVESIEKGESAAARAPLLQAYLQPVLDKGADTLILGCTHYALIKEEITALAGQMSEHSIEVLDTGPAVAKELLRRLGLAGTDCQRSLQGKVQYYTSGDPGYQSDLIFALTGSRMAVESLPAQEEFIQF